MTTIKLRDYQESAVQEIRLEFRARHAPVLLVMPTGSGKTYTFSFMAASGAGKGRRIIIIVHRKELLLQASASLRALGIEHGMISPHFTPNPHAMIQVASVDTLLIRLKKHPARYRFDIAIFDEAHHVLADNKWGRAWDQLGQPLMLGVTATPVRTDGKGLGAHAGGVFKSMVLGPLVPELIAMGKLINPIVYTSLDTPDLSGLRKDKDGEYNRAALAERVDKPHITGSAVEHYGRICPGAKAIVFCSSIRHAKHVRDEFNAAGYKFELLCGAPEMSDSERTAINRKLRRGEIHGACTVDLVSEGYDLPDLECCIMLRPTASEALYLQQCLDDETEILTQRGWLGRSAIDQNDMIAGFDIQSGCIEWCEIEDFIERPLAVGENMYGVSGPHLNVRVTGGHDMIVKSYGPLAVNWHKFTAAETSERRGTFRIPVNGKMDLPPCGLSDDELRFVGWFLTDGSRNKRTNGIAISQSSAKAQHYEHIRSAIRGAGLKFGECRVKRTGDLSHCPDLVLFTVSKGAPRGHGKHLSGWAHLGPWLDKSIPAIFDTMNSRDLSILLEAMNLGDGANQYVPDGWTRRTMSITTGDNAVMADRIQALCVTRGYRCNRSVASSSRGHADQYFLHINQKHTATVAGKGIPDGAVSGKNPYSRSRFRKVESVAGETVWCVKNRLGSLITRRDGKVAVLGNCGRIMRPSPTKRGCWLLDHCGNVGVMIDGMFKIKHGLPDQVREWTLDGRKKKKKGQKEVDEDTIDLRQCPKCYIVHPPAPTCPACGYVYPAGGRDGIEQVDGELHQITPEMQAQIARDARIKQGKAQTVDEMVKQLGYSRGRAEKIFEARQAKDALVNALISDLQAWRQDTGQTALEILGVPMMGIKTQKPKALKDLRERFDEHRSAYATGQGLTGSNTSGQQAALI